MNEWMNDKERLEAMGKALAASQKIANECREEAERYKKLYESATKRKHELFLGVIAIKKALEEVV